MITVLSGSNSEAIRQKLTAIKNEFKKQYGTSGIENVAGERLQPEQLSSLLAGATLFALDRLVIIRGLSENKLAAEQFIKVLETISDQTQVILIEGSLDKRTLLYKTLKKVAEFHEFAELDEGAAVKWVQKIVSQEGGEIDAATARLLVRYAGTNQSRLSNEASKLVAYSAKVTSQAIEELVEKQSEETIFQLLEYALSGKTEAALGILDSLERAHEDPFQTVNMLIWQTNILAIVHSARNVADSEIAKKAKLNPFVVRKTRILTSNMSRQRLHNILNAVSACDVQLKTTSTDPWRVIEQAVLSF